MDFELVITKESIVSTDGRFNIESLSDGDNYEAVDTYFERDGKRIERIPEKYEQGSSCRKMPRLAFQIFEEEILGLSKGERKDYQICQYSPNSSWVKGIYSSIEEYQKIFKKDRGNLTYKCKNGQELIIACWNVFSTIFFVQKCLRDFGKDGDKFVLIYRDKQGKNSVSISEKVLDNLNKLDEKIEYKNEYSEKLLASKNIIFRGAPGTGKTFLAREIAADIVSGGQNIVYDSLTDEEKSRVGFVQFHPSYDYSDFVEGLRPVKKSDDSNGIGFECRDGIFKEFADRARGDSTKNYVFIIDEINRGEISKILGELFFAIDPGYRGKKGEVTTQYANMHEEPDEKFYIPENVYIIGTMNDIDRSVDTFDFAMRRRFGFIEIKAAYDGQNANDED